MAATLVIHGGAGSKALTAERAEAYARSLERILTCAYPVLKSGGSALDAVIRAAELLEDDPLYNAGLGSKIQRDGHIRMSASLMDGHRRRFSGCVNVEGVKNPIRLAEALLDEDDRVLAGRGARAFAESRDLALRSPFTARARAEYRARHEGKTGTIGAIALDRRGRLAAATSTGGRGFEFPHRVSDSPTVAGNFANPACAVSATGPGERIVEFAVASSICALVEAGIPLEKAVAQLLRRARRDDAGFGFIALDRRGRILAEKSCQTLIWAAATPKGFTIFRPAQRS